VDQIEDEAEIVLARLEEFLERFVIEILASKSFIGQDSEIRVLPAEANPVIV
jgi:hypothetical protein